MEPPPLEPHPDPAPRPSLVDTEAVQFAVLQASFDPIVLMDAAGLIREFNPAAESVFGFAREAVLGLPLADLLLPARYRAAHRQALDRFVASGESPLLGRRHARTALRADGTEFPVELAVAVVPGRAGPLFAGYLRDLSEQRRAEGRQRLLLEASREVAGTLDFEDTLRRVARLLVPTLCDGCGVYLSEDGRTARRVAVANADPEREAIARQLHPRHLLPSQGDFGVARVLRTGRAELIPEMTDAMLAAVAVDADQLQVLRALGVRSSMIVPLRVRDRLVGALSLVTDASGRTFGPADLDLAEEFALRTAAAVDNSLLYRQASEAVARAAEEARLREDLIRALARSNAELEAFAQVASHDLRAPLRGIAALSGWIADDLGDELPDAVRHHLGLLQVRVQRLEELIAGILSYARAGRADAEVTEVDVGDLLSDAIELLAPPVTARVTVDPGMPALRAARAPLQQVFMNLIGNALKHAAGPATTVRVGVRDLGGHWEFSVTDNGPGIAPTDHERIWGAFQTLHARDDVDGSGLGLSVVRKIVAAAGGRAWVESAAGAGARFRFTWPKAAPPG